FVNEKPRQKRHGYLLIYHAYIWATNDPIRSSATPQTDRALRAWSIGHPSEIGRYRSACERLYRVEQTISRDSRRLFLPRSNRARYVSVQLCGERQVRGLFVVQI